MAWIGNLLLRNPELVERLRKGATTIHTVHVTFKNNGPKTVWVKCQKKVDYGSDAMYEVPAGQTERWSRQWNMHFDFAVYCDPSGAPASRLANPLVKTSSSVTLTWDGKRIH